MAEPSTSELDGSVRIARVVPRTAVEGPGVRTAVWVQGCSVRCAGCFNPHTWAAEGGTSVPVAALLAILVDQEVEGITLLGGEPFDQGTRPGPARRGGAGVR